MSELQEFAKKPWGEIVKEKELRECRECKAVICGTGDRSWGRPPNRQDASLCECCQECSWCGKAACPDSHRPQGCWYPNCPDDPHSYSQGYDSHSLA